MELQITIFIKRNIYRRKGLANSDVHKQKKKKKKKKRFSVHTTAQTFYRRYINLAKF